MYTVNHDSVRNIEIRLNAHLRYVISKVHAIMIPRSRSYDHDSCVRDLDFPETPLEHFFQRLCCLLI